jgi:N-acetylmuramoyl-L-alanine amidase
VRNIKEIIIHCSATPAGRNIDVAEITKWHLARGFKTIGYHYVIYLDGSVHKGRDEDEVGAHCLNHNSISIGICYIGGLSKDGKTSQDTRTEAQKTALIELLKELKRRYPQAKIHSHRDFAKKDCPCFDATKEYASL